jgi:hypothetical protein
VRLFTVLAERLAVIRGDAQDEALPELLLPQPGEERIQLLVDHAHFACIAA